MENGSDHRFSSDWRTGPESHTPSSPSQNPFLNHGDSDNNIGNRGTIMNNNHNQNSLFPPSTHEPSSPGNPFIQDPANAQIHDSFGAFDAWGNQPHVCENVPTNVEPQDQHVKATAESQMSEESSDDDDSDDDDDIYITIGSMSSKHAPHDHVVAGRHSASSSSSSSMSSAEGSIEEFDTRKEPSEIQNPPVQVMERPEGGVGDTGYVFPPHVFDRNTTNPTGEWSTASNESLFSIYMGNMSFTNELMCFNNKSSTELDKPGGDMFMLDTPPNASSTKQQPQPQPQPTQPLAPPPVSKFTDISQRTAELHEETAKVNNEAKAFETMREVIMETSRTAENAAKGGDGNFKCSSNASTQSFAFQCHKDTSASPKGVEDRQKKQQNQSEDKQQEAPKAAVDATKNAPPPHKKFLYCFPCCPFC